MRLPVLVYQLLPIAVLLLPLIEVVAFTLYWRRSISSVWLYGVLGVVLAYGVAAASVFVAEKYLARKEATGASYVLQKEPTPTVVQYGDEPTFAPLTTAWFGLLLFVVLACGMALWGLRAVMVARP